jgi:hypothetical protein
MIDQKQLENVGSLKYLCSMLTNGGRCTGEIKCRIALAKAVFNNKKRALFTGTLKLKLRKKIVKCYIRSRALYGAETWTLRPAKSETPGKFLNVVMQKNGEDQLDRSREK